MDLCIKTGMYAETNRKSHPVSILVLMDLCIKTRIGVDGAEQAKGFNPCFNGSMYKNCLW